MKGKRDYTGNERGIPGGVWFTDGGKKHEKLKEFFKTHVYIKGTGWINKEDLEFMKDGEK